MESDTGAATEGPADLPAPRPNGLFAGPADAPDRFELLGEGRRGGEGLTWRASYHGELRAAVPLAVKALHRPDGVDDSWPSAEILQRWKDRTVLLQHLHLDRVVWLNEVFVGAAPHRKGADGDGPPVPYLVMEWVDGPNLVELVGGEPATAATVGQRMQYVHEIAEALHELHAASRSAGNPSLHRDVKPGNCIVHPARGVVLIDVGGMRTADDGFDPAGMHTPGYTAPEILRNPFRRREASGDWYALGALAVFCLLGKHPKPAGAALPDLVAPQLRAVARSAGVTDPDALTAHVIAMLRSDPASRPADGPRWATELRQLAVVGAVSGTSATSGTKGRARRRSILATASVIALAAIGGGVAVAAPWKPAPPGADLAGPVVVSSSAAPAPVAGDAAPPSSAPSTGLVAGTVAPELPTSVAPVLTVDDGVTEPEVPPVPSASPTPRVVTTTAPATITTTGKISAPAAGTGVQKCAFVSGTARLAAGQTLILAARNLDNDEPDAWYVQYPRGWNDPSTLASWQGVEYFPGAVGQHYEIGLFAVDLDAAETAHAGGDKPSDDLADVATPLATRRVVQIAGGSGSDCD
ncbi:serine/threonine protein kinase [Actinoplanes palleronii]|uniref:non-specific serine/threonine protein kinase n=1 Tax=Actinoplanes palleronii TaxID=113570 RepID=A0ABQ4BQD1_9ACTN|nr:protein kinase [Actinoplanes palleronii]GIE72506.1 hypothetical protein Apa02nite_086140 [Actinoplanes palleronii]